MGLGKTYSTRYLADSNNNTGAAGQVLSATATGIDWVDGSGTGIIGGPYLPLSAGSTVPLTGDLYISNATYIRSTDSNGAVPRTFGLNSSNNMYIGPIDSYAGGAMLYGVSANVTAQVFYTGATERMRITSVGNVGIGTTSPTAKLQVNNQGEGEFAGGNSASAGDSHLMLKDEGGTTRTLMSGPSIVFQTPANSDGTNIWATSRLLGSPAAAGSARGTFSIQVRDQYDPLSDGTSWNWRTALTAINTGNVGIGTTSPNNILHVSDAGTSTLVRVGNNAAYDAGIYFNTSTDWTIGTDTSNSNAFTIGNSSSVGASPKVTIATGGNVGIGTSNPETSRLLVRGSTNDGASLIFQAANLAGASRYVVRPDGDNKWYKSDNSLSMILTSTGNVGINTTSPGAKFQVKTATNQNIAFNLISGGSLNGTQRITAYNDAVSASVPLGISALEMYFLSGAANTEAMRIDSAGNVGIGYSTPIDFISVGADNLVIGPLSGNNGITVNSATTGYGALAFADGTGSSDQYRGLVQYNHTADSLALFTNASTKMTILSGGNVGIGTTSPSADLHVNSVNAQGTVIIGRTGSNIAASTGLGVISFPSDYNSSPTNYAQIRAYSNALSSLRGSLDFNVKSTSGSLLTGLTVYGTNSGANVGIGTDSPDANLDILNGTTGASLKLSATSTAYWQLQRDSVTGNLNISDDALGNVMSFDQLTGNVGIGTTTPNVGRLEVGGASPTLAINSSTNTDPTLFLLRNGGANGIGLLKVRDGGHLSFDTGATGAAQSERMRITSTGGISFGSTGTAYGTSGQVLTSAGNASPTWVTPTTGTIGGSIADNQIAVGASTANNIEGATDFTYIDGRISLGDSNGVPSMYIGSNAGTNATTGGANVGVGRNSMELLETAYSNSAFGAYSLSDAVSTAVNQNTAIGQDTLGNMTAGVNNVALGDSAGYFIGTASAGLLNSSYSVYLGHDTRPAADNETNQIVIGSGARGGGSNTVTLGNSNITTFRIPGLGSTNGHVLTYNTTAGGFILAAGGGGGGIGGATVATQVAFGSATSSEITSSAEATFLESAGKTLLQVGSTGGKAQSIININQTNNDTSRARLELSRNTSTRGFLGIEYASTDVTLYSNDNLVLDSDGDDVIITTQSTSNVGVGNTTPDHKLDVTGRIKASKGLQVGEETSTAANAASEGTIRYRAAVAISGGKNASLVEMCMQDSATPTYAWVIIGSSTTWV